MTYGNSKGDVSHMTEFDPPPSRIKHSFFPAGCGVQFDHLEINNEEIRFTKMRRFS
jgi:hypothetical protein